MSLVEQYPPGYGTESPESGEGGGDNEAPSSFPQLDLTVKLDPERKRLLAQRIWDELEHYRTATERRRQNSIRWRLDYEQLPPGTANRWVGSSDVNSPFARIYTDSHHARLNQQIMNAVPPFAVVARDPQAMESTTRIEDCLRSVLEQAEWDEFADQVHGEISCCGNCFARITWEQRIERHPRIVVDHDEQETIRQVMAGADESEALWQGVKGVKFVHEDVLAYDGVNLRCIPWEDGFLFPATARDPEEAYGIGEVYMLRGDAMMEGVKRQVYDADAVDYVLSRSEDQQPLHRRERLEEQGLIDQLGGPHMASSLDERLYKSYECVELCWHMDVDDDGMLEWIVIVMHLESRTILRCQYLPYEHGQPYYMMYRYIIRPNELFGMGIPELIAGYQDAHVNVLNQILDHQDLTLNMGGNFFYDNTAGYYPDRFELQMGRGIRVDNLGGIKPVQPTPLPAEAYKLSQQLKDYCDLMTATSNPSLGKATDTSKTLGEVQIVQSASHMIFEDYAARVARQHAKCWDHIRWLTAQYGVGASGMVSYRRTAAPNEVDFNQIPPQLLKSRVDLVPSGLQQLSDMGTRVQTATLVRTAFLNDPLVANNVEAKMILNEEYLRSLRYSQREKLVAAINKGIEAQRAVQQLEMMHGQGGSPLLGGPGGAGPGGPAVGSPGIPGAAVPGSVNPAATAQTAETGGES